MTLTLTLTAAVGEDGIDNEDDSNGCLVVTLLLKIWIRNVDLGLQHRIVGVDLVEYIAKASILCLDTTINR
eukprot:scaffold36576_cov372-Skeletonema_dohrnii-CCMP3373.AAC.2